MKEFKDKVAVVTGAASGIGRAIADKCAAEGMKVVLADINEKGLADAEAELRVRDQRTGSESPRTVWRSPSAGQQCSSVHNRDRLGKHCI
jgi:NAD(P)-dependent dehydrogenase (short-subunit alcohol dehydrogenase family)